jgi:hypothetical protein
MDQARRTSAAVAGLAGIDLTNVQDSVEIALTARAASIPQLEVHYAPGAVFPRQVSRATVDSIALVLRALIADATLHGWEVVAQVQASADTVGAERVNAELRAARSDVLRWMLLTRGVASSNVAAAPDSSLQQRVAVVRVTLRPSNRSTP